MYYNPNMCAFSNPKEKIVLFHYLK